MALSLNGQPKRLHEAGEKTGDDSKGYRYVVFNHVNLTVCREVEGVVDLEVPHRRGVAGSCSRAYVARMVGAVKLMARATKLLGPTPTPTPRSDLSV